MGTEKQYATAQREPQNLSPAAAERQITDLLEAMAQYFAEPNLFRTESACRRIEDLNRSFHKRKRWRNEGAKEKEAFQDATTSKAQAVERNGNEENKRGKEREAAAKRAEHPALNRTLRVQAPPPMQQPLCAVSLLDSKGDLQKKKEKAASHVEREELNAKFSIVP